VKGLASKKETCKAKEGCKEKEVSLFKFPIVGSHLGTPLPLNPSKANHPKKSF